MKIEEPNYYAVIPANVRYDTQLRDKAKLLYGEISSLSNKDGYCYASNKYFANLYNVSITTISLLIKNLVDRGYIQSEIIYKEGSKEILNRYLKIVKYPIKENLKDIKDNNTNINNTNINNNIYSEVINYLNEKTNQHYKSSTNKTIALIKARINEGFNLDDFKKVIDNKAQEWLETDMEKYLRPETLFGTKFEGYLNQKNSNLPKWFGKDIKKEVEEDKYDELAKQLTKGTWQP